MNWFVGQEVVVMGAPEAHSRSVVTRVTRIGSCEVEGFHGTWSEFGRSRRYEGYRLASVTELEAYRAKAARSYERRVLGRALAGRVVELSFERMRELETLLNGWEVAP